MNVQLYSDLDFNLKDAADSIIEDATANEKTSNVGYDLGSDQTAVFEIRQLDDEIYYLKESLYSGDSIYVDDDTEGEYDYFTMVEYITARLQILDQVTDYPRMPESKKSAIEKALALVGIEKYRPSQRRDRSGKFGEEGLGNDGGGGRGRGGASGGTPTGTLRVSGSGLTVGPSGRSSRYVRTGAGAKPATASRPTAAGGAKPGASAKPAATTTASSKPAGKTTGNSGTGPALSTKDNQKKIFDSVDDSSLGPGNKREILDRNKVYQVNKPIISNFNSTHTIGTDGGAVYNPKIKNLAARPANYPKDQPYNPRDLSSKVKVGDFSKKNEYPAWFTKEEAMNWVNEGALGERKAQVALAELSAWGRKRQGNIDGAMYGQKDNVKGNNPNHINRFLEKNKLASFDVDVHHMIPASLGGSNTGPNLVAYTPKEHAIAHVLEWSMAKSYKKDGGIATPGKWGGTWKTFEATGANISANKLYIALSGQTTSAKNAGNKDAYYKKLFNTPDRKQSAYSAQKAANIFYKKGLISSNDLTKIKVDNTGRPVWSNNMKKDDALSIMESSIIKEGLI
jgi:hypothetical protein